MPRAFRDLLDDYRTNPDDWDIVVTETVPSTNTRNSGGLSIQEVFQHRSTGEEMVRHTLVKSDGSVFQPPHFRPAWK